MKLCVVLPVYNAARYLEECLNSLLNQTFRDFYIFAVNDASTDESGKILDRYAALDERLKVFHFQKNGGEPAATEFLFKIVDQLPTKYVARMDADDICLPNRFERQVEFLDQNPNVDVLGTNVIFYSAKEINQSINQSNVPTDDANIKLNLARGGANILNPTAMWRQESIKPLNIKYDVLRSSCDYAMWVKIALSNKIFANLKEPLLIYRIHDEQESNKIDLITNTALVSSNAYLKRLFPELNQEQITVLAKILYAIPMSFTIKECEIAFDAYEHITNRTLSVLGENREELMNILHDYLEILRKKVASL